MLFNRVIHKGDAGDDKAGAAAGARRVVVDTTLVKTSLLITETERSHRCHGKAVLYAHFSYLHLSKKDAFRTHKRAPFVIIYMLIISCQYLHVNHHM